jgi:hypothetical protein
MALEPCPWTNPLTFVLGRLFLSVFHGPWPQKSENDVYLGLDSDFIED